LLDKFAIVRSQLVYQVVYALKSQFRYIRYLRFEFGLGWFGFEDAYYISSVFIVAT
jgi:hypothetical protein